MSRQKNIQNPHYFGMRMEKTLWYKIRSLAIDKQQSTSEFVRECIEKTIGHDEPKNKVK